jgi:hypothetical protein
MIYMLNTASNEDVFIDGLVTVEGFSKSKCWFVSFWTDKSRDTSNAKFLA